MFPTAPSSTWAAMPRARSMPRSAARALRRATACPRKPARAIATATISPSSCASGVGTPSSASTGRRHSLRRSTARKTATANDSVDNADDDVTDNDGSDGVAADAGADADEDGPGMYAAANDAASLTDCRQHEESAVAVDDKKDYGDGDCYSEGDCGNDDFEADGTVVDEDVNVAAAVVPVGTAVSEDGREPLPLLILAPPPRELLVSLLLSEQVRGPVREVEESEYDWEEDP